MWSIQLLIVNGDAVLWFAAEIQRKFIGTVGNDFIGTRYSIIAIEIISVEASGGD